MVVVSVCLFLRVGAGGAETGTEAPNWAPVLTAESPMQG